MVEPTALAQAVLALALDADKRRSMGAAGLERAREVFDWPVILDRYVDLAEELGRIRAAAGVQRAEPWPTLAHPFARFAHFPTQRLGGNWQVRPQPNAAARLRDLLGLSMAGYAFDAALLPKEAPTALLTVLERMFPLKTRQHTMRNNMLIKGIT